MPRLAATLLGCILCAMCALAAEEDQDRCQENGGVTVAVELFKTLALDGETKLNGMKSDFPSDLTEEELGNRTQFCVPKNCGLLTAEGCAQIKGWIAEKLLRVDDNNWKLAMNFVISNHDWLLKGTGSPWTAEGFEGGESERVSQRPLGRVLVVSHHAPLAAVLAENFELAAASALSALNFDIAYYSACYLCPDTSGCLERHVPSLADKACDMFHNPDTTFSDIYGLAADVVRKEPNPSAVLCFGVTICNVLFDLLNSNVLTLQLLCMNPLQGVPASLAGLALVRLKRRLADGEPIFATNQVTLGLLEYHMGQKVAIPTLTFFRSRLCEMGSTAQWPVVNGPKIYLASSFLMQSSQMYWAFKRGIEELLPAWPLTEGYGWHLNSDEGVTGILEHTHSVYLPEHPYKNYFNDLYSLLVPMLLPSAPFLARIWVLLKPQDSDADDDQPYEGWFDSTIPRTRLNAQYRSDVPEPFDLRSDGEAKVLH
ncbi:unnamed protein product, partial [Polarella glacialis]